MIAKLKKRWLRPRVLGVVVAKILLMGSTDLAAQTSLWNGNHAAQHVVVSPAAQSPEGCSISSWGGSEN